MHHTCVQYMNRHLRWLLVFCSLTQVLTQTVDSAGSAVACLTRAEEENVWMYDVVGMSGLS